MTDVAQVMAMPIAQKLLRDEPVPHLCYTARDGGPRVIPIALPLGRRQLPDVDGPGFCQGRCPAS